VGDLSAFATTDQALTCLSQDQAIPVSAMSSAPDELFVLASTASGDCTDVELLVVLPDSLGAGQVLTSGQSLQSANGRYTATLEADGNLVVEGPTGTPIWSSGTGGNPGDQVLLQSDGTLVVESDSQATLWQSPSPGSAAGQIVMENNGSLALIAGATTVWATPPAPT
jgi:hypothetical protein